MVLQPILQAAGRILEVHPVWKVLSDWTNRRLVPEDRLHRKDVKVKRPKTPPAQKPAKQGDSSSSESEKSADSDDSGTQWRARRRDAWDWPVYIHVDDGLQQKPPLDSQQSLDLFLAETNGTYDIVEAVWDQLIQDVEFQIGFGTPDKTEKKGSFPTIWGFTIPLGQLPYTEKDCYPRIEIAAIGVWPLLTHTFTTAEEGVAAKHVLSTLLHETCVRFVSTSNVMAFADRSLRTRQYVLRSKLPWTFS